MWLRDTTPSSPASQPSAPCLRAQGSCVINGGRGFARAHALSLRTPQWVRGKQNREQEVSPNSIFTKRYRVPEALPPGETYNDATRRHRESAPNKGPTGPVNGRLLLLLVPHGGQEAPRDATVGRATPFANVQKPPPPRVGAGPSGWRGTPTRSPQQREHNGAGATILDWASLVSSSSPAQALCPRKGSKQCN